MGSQAMSSVVMIVLLFALMYFMMIRPEKKRKQQAQQMRDNLKKGDTVTTIGGVIGKVVSLNQDTFVVETSEDRVRIEFAKWASVSGLHGFLKARGAEAAKKAGKDAELPEEPEAPEIAETSEETSEEN